MSALDTTPVPNTWKPAVVGAPTYSCPTCGADIPCEKLDTHFVWHKRIEQLEDTLARRS